MDRLTITVRGTVQGVGFRPFVHALARRFGLTGFVRNHGGEVRIEAEGDPTALERFVAELTARPPPLARVDHVGRENIPPVGDRTFRIETSGAGEAGPVFVAPDVATCDACLAELFDPADRRFRYPFLNCTNCGPRLTIVRGAPYDRGRTTMAGFRMCPACRAEYDDPADRRFHAQPTACPACGPALTLRGPAFEPRDGDPLGGFVAALRAGGIGAVKGLGGYHLACDARNPTAVAELRRRKHRDEKPFAVMVAGPDAAGELCHVTPAERDLLASPRRPIVLLRKRTPCPVAAAVAPGNPSLGVMLPYAPLHHLLVRDFGGPVVMTSGNRSDEPIAYTDDEAKENLAGIADAFLTHDRPIHVRCDDSVSRVADGIEYPVRRSRGYAPEPVRLPAACPRPVLAVGGQLKATFALGRGRHAFLSHHLGDLDQFEAYRAFLRDVTLYEGLFAARPEVIAHDLHPDYATTRYARQRAGRDGLRLLAVQHHHAHVASCMAEHGLNEPVIGVAFDGTGYGADGSVWGGEFLIADYRGYERVAHLRYVGMPGGDRAVREPWRMAAAHLLDAGEDPDPAGAGRSEAELRTLATMLERGLNAPPTSSAGRLFDAVAALAGVRQQVAYEGQAAVELEGLATDAEPEGVYAFEVSGDRPLVIDTRPLIQAVAADVRRGVSAKRIARRFHSTVVEAVAAVCGRLRAATGRDKVTLSGGVFLNALLTTELTRRLASDGFRVYRHRLVPPNDGGLSLGQLAVAAARTD